MSVLKKLFDRRYTLGEIDEMRRRVDHRHEWGFFGTPPDGTISRSRDTKTKAREVEDQLRTYMLAGLGPDDLVDKDPVSV